MRCDKCGGRLVPDDEITSVGWMDIYKCINCGKRSEIAINHVEATIREDAAKSLLVRQSDTEDDDDLLDNDDENIDYEKDITAM